MKNSIKNLKAFLDEIQKHVSEVLTFIDICESIANGADKKAGVRYTLAEEFQQYRDEVQANYLSTLEYIQQIAKDKGEDLVVNTQPFSKRISLCGEIERLDEENKSFVLKEIVEKMQSIRQEIIYSIMDRLHEEYNWHGEEEYAYFTTMVTVVELLDGANELVIEKLMKINLNDLDEEK